MIEFNSLGQNYSSWSIQVSISYVEKGLKLHNLKHPTKQQVDSGSQSHATIAIVHIVVQFWRH